MKLLLLTCSQGTSVDQLTNRLSIFNVFDGINSPTFPLVMPPMSIAVWLEREDADPQQVPSRIEFVIDDEALGAINATVDFQGKQRSRLLVEVASPVVPRPGIFRVRFWQLEELMGEFTMLVGALVAQTAVAPDGDTANAAVNPPDTPPAAV